MTYPLVLDLAADSIPVAVTCRVLGFSKQAFYAWCKDPVPQRDWDEAQLINAALECTAISPGRKIFDLSGLTAPGGTT
jgi:putative transposase